MTDTVFTNACTMFFCRRSARRGIVAASVEIFVDGFEKSMSMGY